jgi:hypothetical protein
MASLETYLYLAVLIFFGALLRTIEVFLRKYGWNWEQFKREELVYSTIYGAGISVLVGLGSELIEFLSWEAIDFTKPYIWVLFIVVGYFGQDQGHQLRGKLNQMEGKREPVVNWREKE